MIGSSTVWRVRLLWLVPVFLVLIMLFQARVLHDFHQTLTHGQSVNAQILDAEVKAMAAQAHGMITLRAVLQDGQVIEKTLALPVSLLTQVQGHSSLPVLVLPGSGQEILIEQTLRSQRSMAMANMFVAGLGAVLASIGIGAWIRMLRRRGDPADAAA